MMRNVDPDVTAGFGQEWSAFTQGPSELHDDERREIFNQYFRLFPWDNLPSNAEGLDAGCGTGRWALQVAPCVGHLHLLDASPEALAVAKQNLAHAANVTFHLASVSDIPLRDDSLDFAYSLGVLHHVPDTLGAIRHIAAKLKAGSPFLIYLYYALDNRPIWFRAIWRMTNLARLVISRFPGRLKLATSGLVAATIYWPIAKFCRLLQGLRLSTRSIPLEFYKDRSFYTMRTDAYDRFCTSLEKRFKRVEIERMLREAGFDQIVFSDQMPFWCAVARKAQQLPRPVAQLDRSPGIGKRDVV
jgi:ubiquinone/menaquinone biosynthesis C-methylase UbiE